jgi:hypothetical protein
LAALAPTLPAGVWNEPFSVLRKQLRERPGAVKGAPVLGAAKRTLDGEDRSERMRKERKARQSIAKTAGKKMAPSLTAHQASGGGGRSPVGPRRASLKSQPASVTYSMLPH